MIYLMGSANCSSAPVGGDRDESLAALSLMVRMRKTRGHASLETARRFGSKGLGRGRFV